MKDFFKNRTWDDYLAMVVIGLIIGGLVIFFIGFYWGFKPLELPAGTGLPDQMGKVSVHKFTTGQGLNSFIAARYLELTADQNYNLFSLAGAISSASGTLYAMVIVSLVGFSLIMLGVLVMLIVIIAGFTIDMIARKKAKKA